MRPPLTKRSCGLVVAICALGLAAPATGHAVVTQTFTTSQSQFDPGVRNQGWWGDSPNFDANDNYIVGSDFGTFRNFFSFDLRSACAASGVTLELSRFDQTEPLTYRLWDVATAAEVLNANTGISQAIFEDLGSGTSFGSFEVADGSPTDVLRFPLNAAGVAAFNAARGGFFSIGGETPGETATVAFLYGFSGPAAGGTQQLVVTCLPTTKQECKNGGWRNYGVFKNQGDCVSFVATEGKNPPGN